MKKVICKVTYDTDASKEVKKVTVGAFGEPEGYEAVSYTHLTLPTILLV